MKRLACITAVLFTLLLPSTAQAHEPWPWWYLGGWTTHPVFWLADHDFDNGGAAAWARDAVLAGPSMWNQVPGWLNYYWNGFRYDIVYGAQGSYNVNGLFWAPIPKVKGKNDAWGDILAWIYTPNEPGVSYFHRWDIRFNSSMPWNKNWKTKNPSLQQGDVWSVSTHEFGHGVGHWTHWDQGQAPAPQLCVPNALNFHTMCSTHYPGTTMMRDPYIHDRHTFTNAYS